MNIVVIAANIAQWIIILSIFILRGLDLGVGVIFLLFVLMAIALINVLALFLSPRAVADTDVDSVDASGLIKRDAMRVRYPETHCAVLQTGNTPFAVIDLSEGGVRIRASSATPFKKKVIGDIQLLSGEQIHFKATVMRREDSETVFGFTTPLGTALLVAEKKALADDPHQ